MLTNYCPVFREKFEQIEMLAVSIEDLDLYRTIQEKLIQKIERLGIYIEANPTSDLTIGDFPYMRNHPIYNLSRIKEAGQILSEVNVIMNSIRDGDYLL